MQREVMVIKDPEIAKLFADENRRGILHLLRHREMSTTDLAKELGKNHSSILHHLALLKEAGLVQEVRKDLVRNMIQPIYGPTAHRFQISYSLTETLAQDDDFQHWRRQTLDKIVQGLIETGYKIPTEVKPRILELIKVCMERETKAFEVALERRPHHLEKHLSRALIHLITNIELARDSEHSKTIAELANMLEA